MLAGLLVVIVILGFVAHQYLKGTALKSFAAVFLALSGAIIAFNYFEFVAGLLIKRGYGGEWAHSGSFLVLFVWTFAVLRVIANKLIRSDIDLGVLVTRCINVICGIFLGLILAGVVLTAVAMAPISEKWPYPRFGGDGEQIDPDHPRKALLNADGFVAGLFRIVSKGSLSSDKSFAVFHPEFLNQVYLNRHKVETGILTVAAADAVLVPDKKNGLWQASENLIAASTGERLQAKPRHNLTIVRVGLKSGTAKDGGVMDEKGNVKFTFAQLRLICKPKTERDNTFAGTAQAIHPLGYMKTANQVQLKQLSDDILLNRADFGGKTKHIDFVFEVPADCAPLIIQFRQNALAQVPSLIPTEQAPEVIPFIQTSKCATDLAEVSPATRARIYGRELAAGERLMEGLSLPIEGLDEWRQAEQLVFGVQTLFGGEEGDRIVYARARLVLPESPRQSEQSGRWGEAEGLAALLEPLEGYSLLSLKCNNPSADGVIPGRQLPVLIDLTRRTHYAVGIVAAGKDGEQNIYQVDYCSVPAEDVGGINGGLVIAANGAVAKPFPGLWLTEQVNRITELYVLYLVEASSPPVIITSVQPAGSRIAAGFKEHEGFAVAE